MSKAVNYHAIIPAAGKGTRFGGPIPKQYLSVANKTVIEHALAPFINHPKIDTVTVALSGSDGVFY